SPISVDFTGKFRVVVRKAVSSQNLVPAENTAMLSSGPVFVTNEQAEQYTDSIKKIESDLYEGVKSPNFERGGIAPTTGLPLTSGTSYTNRLRTDAFLGAGVYN